MLGGLVGVVVGLVGQPSHDRRRPTRRRSPTRSLLAFGVAVAVGLFFGIYPANRAASLRPIDALRYE